MRIYEKSYPECIRAWREYSRDLGKRLDAQGEVVQNKSAPVGKTVATPRLHLTSESREGLYSLFVFKETICRCLLGNHVNEPQE